MYERRAEIADTGSLEAELARISGERWVLAGESLEDYRHDGTFMEGEPIAAVLPAGTEEVTEIVKTCARARVPIFARGRGTSLVGGPVATTPGVVLSLERMSDIEIDAAAMVAVVGPGAVTGDIQAAAAEQGLMYPPDPASAAMSSIGGNIACNAGGMGCLKYGVTADYVLGLTVVLSDGAVMHLGGRTRKRSSGYRLAQLFVGSEGTLGIITEAVLKLLPNPKHRVLAAVSFGSVEAAGAAVVRVLAAGYLPCALELVDRSAIELVEGVFPGTFSDPPPALLLVEQDGSDEARVLDEVLAIAELMDGDDARVAQSSAERDRLWAVRRNFGKALLAIPKNYFAEDVAVPVDAIPEMVGRVTRLAEETGLRIVMAGHAGDGNLHPCIVFDDDQRPLVGAAAARIFQDAVSLGGTISAEHGLGVLKRDHATLEHEPREIETWRALKRQFDPDGLLNPHKLLPEGPADAGFLERQPGWGSRRGEAGV